MTDEQATALGKRLVACKGFRPMRGMLDMQGRTWDQSLLWRWSNDVDVPDLRDPATLGCLLALVREAWADPAYLWGGHAEVRRDSETLFVVLRFGHDANGFLVERWVSSGATEAEALVAALEAAP